MTCLNSPDMRALSRGRMTKSVRYLGLEVVGGGEVVPCPTSCVAVAGRPDMRVVEEREEVEARGRCASSLVSLVCAPA